ncbi:MAG: membrane protein insertase YidC [Deltaproteobacteria bacterium]|nr:membrane protein insertase YidC [Deltaproteobacteria bacterium]
MSIELDPNEQAAQDRRMLLAMALTAIVVFAYYNFFAPPPPPPAEVDAAAETAEGTPDQATPAAAVAQPAVAEPVVAVSNAPDRILERGWDKVTSKWSANGGSPSSLVLPDYVAQAEEPAWLPTWVLGKFTGKSDEPFDLTCATAETHGFVDVIRAEDAVALPVGIDSRGIASDVGNYEVVTDELGRATFRTVRDGVEITKDYAFPDSGYVTSYTVTLRNGTNTAREVTPSFGVVDHMPEPESRYGPRSETHVWADGDHESADEAKLRKKADKGDALSYEGPIEWWAVGDKYFLIGLEPAEPLEGTGELVMTNGEAGHFAAVVTTPAQTLAPGESKSWTFKLWTGPKTIKGLEKADMRMAASVDFGIFGLVAIPILSFLQFLHGLLGSWGFAIIVLTLTVKLLLFPLTQKQYRSMKDMQDLNPEIAELRESMKDDKEALNKEMMKLFQERGVNPMGGCLPMIVQMPIWFALYRVLWMSADLYQVPYMYFCDLTLQDPIGILPTLMAATMYVTTKMNQSPTMDPTQQRIMTLMPVMFGFIMFTLPAGLVLYIFVNNILSILQQWVIKRGIGEKPKTAGSNA